MKHPPIITAVMAATCEAYGVTEAQARRGHCVAQQVAAYVIRRVTGRSYAWIGKQVGFRPHSTVQRWCSELELHRQADPRFRELIERLEDVARERRAA